MRPAVCIRVSSLSQILGPIRPELTESCHAAVDGLLSLLRRSVGCKSIESPALQTTASRRAILATSCSHSFDQPESNSGSNPTSIDRESPCCCCWTSWLRSPSRWITSPAKHQRVGRKTQGVRSAWPDVCIRVRSLSQTLGQIRPVLTKIRTTRSDRLRAPLTCSLEQQNRTILLKTPGPLEYFS